MSQCLQLQEISSNVFQSDVQLHRQNDMYSTNVCNFYLCMNVTFM